MARKKQKVGLIGLGIIGSRVAANLRKAGYDVWVWSRSPKAEPNFLASPAEVAETADVILLFVGDGPALIEVVKAMAPSLSARHVVVNHATVGPDEAREAAALTEGASAGFLEAPFTGSRLAAEAGQLVYYVGGSPEILARVRPVLDASAKAVVAIGEVGQASLVKLATNLVTAATVEALAEAMALVDRNGVSLERFAEAVELNAMNSPVARMKIPSMAEGRFDPHFSLKNMFKDLQLVLAAAERANLELPAAGAAAGALMAGIEHGWADEDFSAIAKHYEFAGRQPVSPDSLAAANGSEPDEAAVPKPKKRFSLFGGSNSL